MKEVNKIFALINSIDDAKEILLKAKELNLKFNATIEVVFVKEEPLFSIDSFFKDKEFNKEEVKKFLKELTDEIFNKDVAIFVYISDSKDRVEHLANGKKDVLVVTKFNKEIFSDILDIELTTLIFKKELKECAFLVEDMLDIEENIEFLQKICPNLYLIYNFIYLPAISAIDPLTEFPIDLEVQEEVFKEQFNAIKSKFNIDGEFIFNYGGLEEILATKNIDSLAFVESVSLDLEELNCNILKLSL